MSPNCIATYIDLRTSPARVLRTPFHDPTLYRLRRPATITLLGTKHIPLPAESPIHWTGTHWAPGIANGEPMLELLSYVDDLSRGPDRK